MECPHCGKTRSHRSNGHKFFTVKSLKDHIRNAHPETIQKRYMPPGAVTCQICGRSKSKSRGNAKAFSWAGLWCHTRDAHHIRLPFPDTIYPGTFVTMPVSAQRYFNRAGWVARHITESPQVQMDDGLGNTISIACVNVFHVEMGTVQADDLPQEAYIKTGGEYIYNRQANTFYPRDQVAYVPLHCDGDLRHEDVELGFVTSVNDNAVFCRYFYKSGELRTTANSEGCAPDSLVLFKHHPRAEIDALYQDIMQAHNQGIKEKVTNAQSDNSSNQMEAIEY